MPRCRGNDGSTVGRVGPRYGLAAFTATFNATGQPAISLPLHWSPDGLPVGVQLVARFGADATLLALAAQLEQAAPWFNRVASL